MDQIAPENIAAGHVDIELAHPGGGRRLDQQACRQGATGAEPGHLCDHQETEEITDPAHRQQRADHRFGIVAEVLQQGRKQDQRGILQHAHDQGHRDTEDEITIPKAVRVKQRSFGQR